MIHPAARRSAVAATLVAWTIACLSAAVAPAGVGAGATDSASRQSSVLSHALDGCVRSERELRPDITRAGAVVRCAQLTSGSIDATARWTTCQRWVPAPGERCETGSARIAFRADRAEGDVMGRLPTPPGGRSWHMLGSGTVTCSRHRHDLAAGERGAVRRFAGTVDHLDGALWPMAGGDRVQSGISIVRGGGYTPAARRSPQDQTACFPLRAEGDLPAALDRPLSRLLGRVESPVRLRRSVDASAPELGRLVGEGRLRLEVRGRTTMTFALKDA